MQLRAPSDVTEWARCGTCKHKGESVTVWTDRGPGEPFKPTPFFQCKAIPHNTAVVGVDPQFPSEHELAGAVGKGPFVIDGSGYHAALIVEESFACAKWEAA